MIKFRSLPLFSRKIFPPLPLRREGTFIQSPEIGLELSFLADSRKRSLLSHTIQVVLNIQDVIDKLRA